MKDGKLTKAQAIAFNKTFGIPAIEETVYSLPDTPEVTTARKKYAELSVIFGNDSKVTIPAPRAKQRQTVNDFIVRHAGLANVKTPGTHIESAALAITGAFLDGTAVTRQQCYGILDPLFDPNNNSAKRLAAGRKQVTDLMYVVFILEPI